MSSCSQPNAQDADGLEAAVDQAIAACAGDMRSAIRALKARRLVSESRTQLIMPSFRRALAEPRPPPQHRSDPIRPMRGILGGRWTQFCGRECPGRYKPAFNFVRGRSCLYHRLTRSFIRYARP